jgi:hypothetical protein
LIAVLAARYAVPPSYSGRAFCRSRRADELGDQLCRYVSSSRALCCRPPQGRQAHGPAGYAGPPGSSCDQPQYRASAPASMCRQLDSSRQSRRSRLPGREGDQPPERGYNPQGRCTQPSHRGKSIPKLFGIPGAERL